MSPIPFGSKLIQLTVKLIINEMAGPMWAAQTATSNVDCGDGREDGVTLMRRGADGSTAVFAA